MSNAGDRTGVSKGAANVEAVLPVTPLQHGMLVHCLGDPEGRVYVEQVALEIRGPLDLERLERAFQWVLGRHEALRTSFVWKRTEQPMQVIHRQVPLRIERCAAEAAGDVTLGLLARERARGIAMGTAPLMRASVVHDETSGTHVLVWTHHHLIIDGWSVPIVLGEVLAHYECNGPPPLPAAPQYRQYLRYRDEKVPPLDKDFFRARLSNLSAPGWVTAALPAPTKRGGTTHDSAAPRTLVNLAELPLLPTQRRARLSREATLRLTERARELRTTTASLVCAAWCLLTAKLSGASDVLLGLTTSGRPPELEGAERMVGLLINTLPFRVTVQEGQRLDAFVETIHSEMAALKPHEWASLADIMAAAEAPHAAALIEGVLVFENYPSMALGSTLPSGLTLSVSRVVEETNYAFMLVVAPGEELELRIDANPSRMDDAGAAALLAHATALLGSMGSSALDATLSSLAATPAEARARQDRQWLQAAAPTLRGQHTLALLLDAAERHTGRVAVVDENGVTTYQDLFRRAEHVARHLGAQGVKPNDVVAVLWPRGTDLVATLLGIWLAGACYLPMGRGLHRDRARAMLADAGVHAALVHSTFENEAAWLDAATDLRRLTAPDPDRPSPNAQAPAPHPRSESAYVLFTSGSTGRPKGVRVPHSALANLLLHFRSTLDLAPGHLWLAITPLTFDIAGLELWAPLVAGATLHLASDRDLADAEQLHRRIREARPTHFQTTPSTLRTLTALGPLGLSEAKVLVGGEALPRELAREVLSTTRAAWNVYGPTETTIWSTAKALSPTDVDGPGYVGLGNPIANTRLLLRDSHGGLLGTGVIGELCIGGEGLAEGYVGDAERTARSFVFTEHGRLYRTGDRASLSEAGELSFHGRNDEQVKIRGHRVELGDIEAALEAHPAVLQAVVVLAFGGDDARAHLAAFVRLIPEPTGIDETSLRAHVTQRLPEIMVPTCVVVVERFPQTANGKVHRAALLAQAENNGTPDAPSGLAQPSDDATEQVLCSIFAGVLGRPQVSPTADFFTLGGHSLLATQVVSRVRAALGKDLPLRALFAAPSPRGLAALLRREGTGQHRPPLTRGSSAASYPLSFAQARLWFIDQLEPLSAFYNIPAAVRIRGPLRPDALHRALIALVRRHETLRTHFESQDGVPTQQIRDDFTLDLPMLDLRGIPNPEAEAERAAMRLVQRPYDLRRDLPLRGTLASLDELDHVLILSLHHIAADGWSVGVLIADLVKLYDAACEAPTKEPVLPPLPVRYVDYARWQRAFLGDTDQQSSLAGAQLARHVARLQGAPVLELPTDHPRPRVQRFRGARFAFDLPAALGARVAAFARDSQATPFMVLLSALSALLFRLGRTQDVCIGTPIAGRTEHATEGLIGFFANTLVLRMTAAERCTLRELLRHARKESLGAYEDQDVPFERIADALSGERDRSRSPLFQVMLVVQNAPRPTLSHTGLSFAPHLAETRTSKADLELTLMPLPGDAYAASLEYDTDLFDGSTAERMALAFRTLLDGALRAPDSPLADLPLLPADLATSQWASVLVGPQASYQTDESVTAAFERHAAESPNDVALLCEEGQFTYGELLAMARRVASALLRLGLRPEDAVGIHMDRGPFMIAAIYGTIMAGGAYVPIEPGLPEARKVHFASIAGVRFVLADAAPAATFAPTALLLDARKIALDQGEVCGELPRIRGAQLAYILFTSGSTGMPKGAMLEHRGVINRIEWQQDTIPLGPTDVVLHKTPMGFDVSVWELFWPLRTGARMSVARPEGHKDPAYLGEWMHDTRVSVVHFVPAMLASFLADTRPTDLPALRAVLASGEALTPALASRLRHRYPNVAIHNLYGPTEASVDVTHYCVPQGGTIDRVPIGRPVAGTWAYVLDAARRPLPRGFIGELCVAGVQVARGYVGADAATSARFCADPLSGSGASRRMYCTGDLARVALDGELEFFGRNDDQVKIRGQRIELGEIEATLVTHPRVQAACVIVDDGVPGDPRLVAYVSERASGHTEPGTAVSDHVAGWSQVFEGTYGEGVPADDPSFDLRGWVRSIDGKPMTPESMGAWVDAARALVLSGGPRRVLEIGCGTGLILFGVAPHVETYVGTDITPRALARVQERATELGLRNVSTRACAAHDIGRLPGEFDAVVLNSVVQYFPDEEHLLRVIALAVEKLPGGGRIILGDVRNAGLLPALCLQIELAAALPTETMGVVRERAARRAESDPELSVHPDFFRGLRRHLEPEASKRLRDVQIHRKAPGVDAELGRYRYDVVLEIAGEPVLPNTDSIARTKSVDCAEVQRHPGGFAAWLRAREGASVVIEQIPHARLGEDAALAATNDNLSVGTVRSLGLRGDEAAAKELDKWIADAEAAEFVTRVTDAGAGKSPFHLRLELHPKSLGPAPEFVGDVPAASLVHAPRRSQRRAELILTLLRHAAETLPAVMVPAAVVVLPALPLSPSGKVLRSALPRAPGSHASRLGRTAEGAPFEAPRGPDEHLVANAIGQLLGLTRVGRDDDFFALGGHSLLATRLVARLSAQCAVTVPLRWVFEARTVKALGAKLAQNVGRESKTAGPRRRPGGPWSQAPLSHAQRRMYLLHALSDSPAQYNVPMAVSVHGTLDPQRLSRAIRQVVRRHVSLRVRFVMSEGAEPQQIPVPEEELDAHLEALLESHDLMTAGVTSAAQNEALLGDTLRRFVLRPFDLARDLPFRGSLIRLRDDAHVLCLSAHHIVCDRWSMDVLLRDILAFYESPDAGDALPPIEIDALDHATWERMPEQESAQEAGTARVVARLEGAPDVLGVCTDRPRKPARAAAGARVRFEIPATTALGVRALAEVSGCTPFAVFLAALGLVFRAYGAGDDVVIGTASAGRTHRTLDPVVGMFVGTVPLRLTVPPKATFRELLLEAAQEALRGLEDASVPLERVAQRLSPARALTHEPVVQALLVLQNTERVPLLLPGASLRLVDAETDTTKLDFTLFLEATDPGYAGAIEYATDIFDEGTIAAIAETFTVLLGNAVRAPDAQCDDLPLLSADAKQRLLGQARGPSRSVPAEPSLTGAIGASLAARNESPALVYEGDTTTGGALQAAIARAATAMHAAGIVPGDTVAIALPRGPAWVAWALGTLALGAAFVPVPPNTPPARAQHMLAESGAALVVHAGDAAAPSQAFLRDVRAPLLCIDAISSVDAGPRPEIMHSDRDLAYVLFTSGSTGAPKGVRVQLGALRNHMEWMLHAFPLGPDDRVLFRTSPAFDASIWELFLPLLAGVPMVIANEEQEADPRALGDLIRVARVTVMQAVPTILRALSSSGILGELTSLRWIFAGGEAFSSSLRQDMAAKVQAQIVNLYGPTETTIDATFHVCGPPNGPGGSTEPIGRPIDNVWALPLNRRGEPVPWGAPGELFVGGAGVALGYTHEQGERFRHDTLFGAGRMYSTGDLTRLRADGTLEYLGRSDGQLKLGGVRLETAEIEATLCAHPEVVSGVVALRGAPLRLVAYVVLRSPEANTDARVNDILAHLRRVLPPAGVPKQLVLCTALPRTTSGKVHRAALPEPPALGAEASALVPTQGRHEAAIAALFSELLGVPAGAESDFFSLGGDSILSLQLVSRARARGLSLSLRDVFEGRTVRALGERCRAQGGEPVVADEGEFPLLPMQERVQRAKPPAPEHFAQAALLVAPKDFDLRAFERAGLALLRTHAALRSQFPGFRTHSCAAQVVLPESQAEALIATALVHRTLPPGIHLAESIPEVCADLTRSLDPEQGHVFKIGLLHEGPDLVRIFVTIHHYVVDTYSFRVLEDDLLSAYAQARRGALPVLPPPSASLRALSAARRSASAAHTTQSTTGLVPVGPGSPLTAPNPEASRAEVLVRLPEAETNRLLARGRGADTAEIEDALLAAFVWGLGRVMPATDFNIAIEGHGRDQDTGTLDTSRLVGWLTRMDLVTVGLAAAEGAPGAQAVRDAVRTARRGKREIAPAEALPKIGFNYLGRLEAVAGTGFAPATEAMGPLRAPAAERFFDIELIAAVDQGTLSVTIQYGRHAHEEGIISRLAQATLEGLAAFARSDDALSPKPTVDASLSGVSDRDLSRIMKKLRNRK